MTLTTPPASLLSGGVLVPALVALVVGVWGVVTQRAMTRRRATMDHMAAENIDKDAIEARALLIKLSREEGGLAKWAEADKESSTQAEAIRLVLNDFELISVSIQYGIMDYEFYHKFNHGTVKKYWSKSASYVHALRERTGSQPLFCEFEKLYGWVNGNKVPRSIWLKKLF